MGASTQSRRFVRTRIPTGEKRVGAAVLVGLAVVFWVVAYKGAHYDPGIYSPDPAALSGTRAPVESAAATLAGESEGVETAGGGGAELRPPVEGLVPMGPTEHYTADTLYEKINGRAPAYLDFNFEGLTARSFGLSAEPGAYVDVFVYRMDTPLNAFGIFSLEREAEGRPVAFAADGYRSAMGYFFRVGRAYVQVVASSPEPAVMEAAGACSEALAGSLPADDAGLEALRGLPEAGRIPGSVTYLRNNAYGQAVLSGVFEARYRFDGVELTYFAMAADTAEAGGEVWASLLGFFESYGEVRGKETVGEARYFEGEGFGRAAVVAVRGPLVSGVMDTEHAEAAGRFVRAALTGSLPAGGPSEAPAEEADSGAGDPYGYE